MAVLWAAHKYSESADPFITGHTFSLQMSLSVATSKLSSSTICLTCSYFHILISIWGGHYIIFSTADRSLPIFMPVITDKFLYVLLNCQRASHFFYILNFPIPQVGGFTTDSISSHSNIQIIINNKILIIIIHKRLSTYFTFSRIFLSKEVILFDGLRLEIICSQINGSFLLRIWNPGNFAFIFRNFDETVSALSKN